MDRVKFKIQRFANLVHGDSSHNELVNTGDNTQIYGLAGNDTLESVNKKSTLLIGGSDNDVVHMAGGSGTLNGGAGDDTFKLTYSSSQTISAVIEDFDPDKDKLVINYVGSETPNISYSTVGRDVVLTDDDGWFNVTLKGYREVNDYFDGTASENVWEVLKFVNQERESQGLNQLTLSQGLIDATSIRAEELTELFSHTRPDGTACYTAIEKSYNPRGENIAAGQISPASVMTSWMNSDDHRANILDEDFRKIGVGYFYKADTTYKSHWVQMFGGALNETETVSTAALLDMPVTVTTESGSTTTVIDSGSDHEISGSGSYTITSGGTYKIAAGYTGRITINTTDAVTIDGVGAGNLENVAIVVSSNTANLTIKDLNSTKEYGGIITFGSGTDNKLTLSGTNELKTSDAWEAVVNVGGGLTIDGTGILNVMAGLQGSGIGTAPHSESSANITVNGGNITATCYRGAGIGSGWNGSIGDIFINGGNITANCDDGAGIGSGYDGSAGNILINGGNITANCDDGAGIGSGYRSSIGNITINDGNIMATASSGGAGIGAGKNASAGNIVINGGIIMATSYWGAGVGTGLAYSSSATSSVGNITIGGDTKATLTSSLGAGVGMGNGEGTITVGKITLSGNKSTSEKSTVLVTQLTQGSLNDIPSEFQINGKTYTKTQLLFEDGIEKTLSEPIIIDETVKTGTDEADNIWLYNSGWYSAATIDAGKGNDTIDVAGANFLIYAGEDNDSIMCVGIGWSNPVDGYVTIYGGAGNDTMWIGATIGEIDNYYSFISGDTGNDSIRVNGNYVTIDGGDGNDRIYGNGENASLIGGSGSDSIYVADENATVKAGAGNDIINNASSSRFYSNDGGKTWIHEGNNNVTYQYSSGDGNDTISGYVSSNKIQISGSSYSTQASGSDVIIKIGSGSITLLDAKNKTLNIETVAGSSTETDTIPAGISISNATFTASTAFTGSKIDLADYASTVTKVNASALSRGVSIVGTAANNSLKGGSGADTISGGAGNDTVILGGGNDIYVYTSGNDLIQDYVAGTDKIKLVGASITSASVSGSNVVLKTSNGNITVKGGKDRNIAVIDASGKETSQVYPIETLPVGISISNATLTASTAFTGSSINLTDYASTVTKVNASALSRGISIIGTATANSLKGGNGADTISGGAGNDTVSLGGGADVYVYTSGDDVIQDYTANADKIKLSGTSITSASVSGSNVVLKTTAGNLTVKGIKDKNITVIDASGTETSRVYPEISSETLPIGLGYDSAKKVLTVGTSYSGAAIDLANFATTTKTVDASKFTKTLKITGTTRAESLVGGSKADILIGGKGNDTFKGNSGNDIFVYASGDGNDIIADFATGDKISLSGASVTSVSLKSSDMVFKIDSGNITVKGGKGKEISIGNVIYYNNLTYDSKKTVATVGAGQTGTLKATDYATSVKKVDASKLTKAINIVGNTQANTINGGSGADKIYGGSGADKLYGNAGADTLWGDAGNDTLYGGAGNDMFVYADSGGNDIIADFATGDKISLSGTSVISASLKSSDIVFKIGSGSLNVKNGKDKDISIGSAIYYNNLIYDSKKTTVTLGSSFSGSLKAGDYDSKTKTINAASVAKAVNITGNSQANSILGGKGADTISGGTGNDTLAGGAGKDVFVYANSDGKDVITDYTAGQDKIKIVSGSISKTSYTGNNVIFTIGSGTLTIQNGKGKKITIIDSNNKTTTQTYSGAVSGRSALWFAEDDNFTTSAPVLDSILQVRSITYSTEYTSATMDFSTQPRDSVSSVSYAQYEITR